ncbi:DUF4328 domain-containing protein [Streptomyces sp. NPDC057136]|uniref:DUF4328 domain-containing protein n=1 Tax=Streptomyces sp. NPDC057136 TaxID=3346029 RepID=UPI00362860B1
MNDPAKPPALRPVQGVAHVAVAALALAGAAWAALAMWHIRLAAAGQPPSGPPEQGGGRHRPLNALENAYHLVSSLAGVATALCAIAFLAWLWSVRDNARTLSGQHHRYAWPWVYAGWVVPIANLWVPRGIIADIHRASAPDERLPHAVNWWWGLWLVGTLTGTGLLHAETADTVIARAYTDVSPLLFVDAAVVGTAVAGALMVRAVTAVQQKHMPEFLRQTAGSKTPGITLSNS